MQATELTLMDVCNTIDAAVGAMSNAVEQADDEQLADEARAIKSDIRAHIAGLLEILEAIDNRLES
jgi:hypothetical protein